jgi:hypothetical protein
LAAAGSEPAPAWERCLARDGGVLGYERANPLPRARDFDGDGLSNAYELENGLHRWRVDTDRDGVSDGHEVQCSSTDPREADSDGDGIEDDRFADLLSRCSIRHGDVIGYRRAEPLPRERDFDGDGLSNAYELEKGLHRWNVDTDGDGVSDGHEVQCSNNALLTGATAAEPVVPAMPPGSVRVRPPSLPEPSRPRPSPSLLDELLSPLRPPPTIPDGLVVPPPPEPPPAMPDGPVVYVAAGGDDVADGSEERPVRTIDRALGLAGPNTTILVGEGSYPQVRDQTARDAPVTVVGRGPTPPEVAGLEVYGGQRISFSGLRFTGEVRVTDHVVHKQGQRAIDVTFRDNEMVAPSTSNCAAVRSGAQDIAFIDNTMHDCRIGVYGAGSSAMSNGIRIEGNTIRDVIADGIQFGDWSDVVIAGNVIEGVRDPEGKIHNDSIQFLGDSNNVVIRNNYLYDSADQVLFIQDAIGPIDDVRVEGNVIAGSGGYAVQSQGATNLVFTQNTVWDARFGGLLLRQGHFSQDGGVPTDSIVTNNILQSYGTTGGAKAATLDNNAVRCTEVEESRPGLACTTDPRFVDVEAGDFHLAPDSPLLAMEPVPGAYTSSGTSPPNP